MTDVVRTFAETYAALSGEAHVVESVEAAAHTVARLIKQTGATCIALANLPYTIARAIEQDCEAAGIAVLQEPFPVRDLPHVLDTAQVGVTGMAFAIAQTGTLVEIATNDAVRLVSALPRTHIGIVRALDIVAQFEEAGPRLRAAFKDHPANCVVSFLSGPSRTGDIELKLTLGVHGPQAAHAIIVQH